MGDVPHRQIRQRPHREWVVAGDAAPRPCIRGKRSKEGHSRRSDGSELLHETPPRAIIRPRGGHRDRLIETGQRTLEPACKPEGAEHKEALSVVDVVHDITDAPLAWGIAMQRLLLRDAEQQVEEFVPLSIEKPANVALRDLIDIGEVVLRGLGAIGNGDHVTLSSGWCRLFRVARAIKAVPSIPSRGYTAR